MSSLLLLPQRLSRFVRTALTLGGGLKGSVRLGVHVLRTQGWRGVAWRLASARDITRGRQDPWRRFALEGTRHKGLSMQRFEQFWSGQDESLAAELEPLRHEPDQATARVAVWTLSRWHARDERWPQVHEVLAPLLEAHRERMEALPMDIKLLWLDALRLTGRGDESTQWLRRMQPYDSNHNWTADLTLAKANLLNPGVSAGGDAVAWLAVVNEMYVQQGLAPIELRDAAAGVRFDNFQTTACEVVNNGPLVSVIVPAFNASALLPTVLRSLAMQTWRALEVLVVDDCSKDDTAAVAEQFAARDGRFRLVRMPINQGAYAARNMGAAQARGDFITVHDGDDWSHAQKIEMQVQALLESKDRRVSFSHWSRTDEAVVFGDWNSPDQWRGYVHRNTSSMMLRRDVFERLGFWDQVRCSADAEYYHRAIRVLGVESLVEVLPGVPLSFGRVVAGSLTRRSDTSLFTLFGGLRKDYHEAFAHWHEHGFDPADPKSLYLEQHPVKRPFEAPEGMLQQRKIH